MTAHKPTLAVFRINSHLYAIPNSALKSFVLRDFARVYPEDKRPYFMGLSKVNNRTVPVFDLRIFCECFVNSHASILVVDRRGAHIGLVVDHLDSRPQLARNYVSSSSTMHHRHELPFLNARQPTVTAMYPNGEISDPIRVLDLDLLFPTLDTEGETLHG